MVSIVKKYKIFLQDGCQGKSLFLLTIFSTLMTFSLGRSSLLDILAPYGVDIVVWSVMLSMVENGNDIVNMNQNVSTNDNHSHYGNENRSHLH